jgi:hypothetical protein
LRAGPPSAAPLLAEAGRMTKKGKCQWLVAAALISNATALRSKAAAQKMLGPPAHPAGSWPCVRAGIALACLFASFVAKTKEVATRGNERDEGCSSAQNVVRNA